MWWIGGFDEKSNYFYHISDLENALGLGAEAVDGFYLAHESVPAFLLVCHQRGGGDGVDSRVGGWGM